MFSNTNYCLSNFFSCVGWDSVVGIVTCYRLGGQGIKSWWGDIFCSHTYRLWHLPSLLYNVYQISFLGVKHSGHDIDHPPPSSAEVKERVEIFLYFCLRAFMACYMVNFTFFCVWFYFVILVPIVIKWHSPSDLQNVLQIYPVHHNLHTWLHLPAGIHHFIKFW